jgi:hypothetical protein
VRTIRNPIDRDIAQLEWNIETAQFWLAKYEAGLEPEPVVIKGHEMPSLTREQAIAQCKKQIVRFEQGITMLKEAKRAGNQ